MESFSIIEPRKAWQLAELTLENLHEAVFWITAEGTIVRTNEKACLVTGYTKDELTGMNMRTLDPSGNGDFPAFWQRLGRENKLTCETRHRRKDGTCYEVELTWVMAAQGPEQLACCLARDLRQKKLEEHLLRTISERTAFLTGEDYFRELTRYITATLNVQYAMVVECSRTSGTRLRTLSYAEGQELKESIEYEKKGAPCEIVMEGREFFCANNLEKSFPREKGIQSWVAVPIYSPTTKKVIGNIAAFDRKPMTNEQNQAAILRIFAARAGAEIERMNAQHELEKANAALQARLQEIEDLKNQLAAENKYLQEEIRLTHNFDEIISRSTNFLKILRQIEQVAATDATVLILGESGTGKELIARAIHNISNRSKRPLVKVNCATLPGNLIESELFGHEKGAFTGAMERKPGRFELADGGTIFLDEIGELPVGLQSKLLRVLQEGEFERLGSTRTIKVNVRVIAATNRNLEKAMEKNEFREDLYYRLNVFPIVCPPLRERREDIPLLVKHFCQKYEGKTGKKISSIPARVMEALMCYDWPGNIRELENIIERGLILSATNTLEYGEWLPQAGKLPGKAAPQKLEDVEREHILATLKKTHYKVSGPNGAAELLGLNPTTLEARMKKLGIVRERGT